MNVVVAGSSGLIGQNVICCLEEKGYNTHRLVRTADKLDRNSILWNPEKKEIDIKKLENMDIVINFCGENIAEGRWTQEKKARLYSSRVKTTKFLANCLQELKNPPQLLINASAVGYYGNTGDRLVREDTPNGEGFLAELCKDWEEATECARQKGIRVTVLRLGVVLTSQGGVLGTLLNPFKLGLGGTIGSGKQYMSWIGLEDLLGIILHVIGNVSVSGPVNVVSPNPVTNYEFTKTLGQILNRPTLLSMPKFLIRSIFGKEKANEMLLSSVRATPDQLKLSGYSFLYPDLESAIRFELSKTDDKKS